MKKETPPSERLPPNPEQLFADNQNLVHAFLKKRPVYLPGYDKQDIEQEAMLVFWQACKKFDLTKGASLSTFAWRCLRNHFNGLIRKESNQIRPDESVEKLVQDGQL